MPTDLTGTPTTLGIGTFNVDADAPSGLGFNEAMAQIDALLATRVTAPVGIAAGEAMVWNGSAWVRSSVTQITANGVAGVVKSPSRKATTKSVVNSTAETDLLNGEISVAAGALGSTGILRLTAWGNALFFTGGTVGLPRFKLKLGATTLFDTNTVAALIGSANSAVPWRVVAEIANTATNAQNSNFALRLGTVNGAAGSTFFTTGFGIYLQPAAVGGVGITTADGESFGTAVDTTVSNALALTCQLSSANANHKIALDGAVVEIL